MNALITGATKGIGRAIAFKLAEAGYHLAICARSPTELADLCTVLQSQFPDVEVYARATDCGDLQDLRVFAEEAHSQLGHIGTLINNVGIYIPATLLDESEGVLEQQMQVNVYAAHELSRFFGKKMRAAGAGHIVNICSVAGIEPVVAAGSYSVTKYALMGLTRVLREELKPAGVKVTAIIPGATLTHSWEGTSIAPEHFIQPEDIATCVLTCLQMSVGATIDEIVVRPHSSSF
jgi:short-subunit dehydrogenase